MAMPPKKQFKTPEFVPSSSSDTSPESAGKDKSKKDKSKTQKESATETGTPSPVQSTSASSTPVAGTSSQGGEWQPARKAKAASKKLFAPANTPRKPKEKTKAETDLQEL